MRLVVFSLLVCSQSLVSGFALLPPTSVLTSRRYRVAWRHPAALKAEPTDSTDRPTGSNDTKNPKSFGVSWRTGEHDRDILNLAAPALLALLTDPLLSIVDTMYVGRLGPINLAAMGPCTSIFHLAFSTFRALTQSTTALISRALSKDDTDQANDVMQQTLLLASLIGICVTGLTLANSERLLTLMGAGHSSGLLEYSKSYLTVRAIAAPAVLSLMVLEGCFRGHADTVTPAIAAVAAAIANFVLDPILMFGMGYGLAGAAAATVISQYFALTIYLGFVLRRYKSGGRMSLPILQSAGNFTSVSIGGIRRYMSAAVPLLKRIVFANTAMLLRTFSILLCWAVCTATVTRQSAIQVGAHQVGLSLWLLLALVAEAPSVASQVLGSRYLGQQKLLTARQVARRAASMTLVSSTVLGVNLLLLRRVIPRCFTSDAVLGATIQRLIPILAVQQPLVALTLVLEGLLVGAQQFKWLGATTLANTATATGVILYVGRAWPQTGVVGVWGGITLLFFMRLSSAAFRVLDRKRGPYWVEAHPDE
ncbi:unnamed protein product [Chrysoparadoxa australica]